jgi:hypothetical protein
LVAKKARTDFVKLGTGDGGEGWMASKGENIYKYIECEHTFL